jgi:hypothetical protein
MVIMIQDRVTRRTGFAYTVQELSSRCSVQLYVQEEFCGFHLTYFCFIFNTDIHLFSKLIAKITIYYFIYHLLSDLFSPYLAISKNFILGYVK